MSIKALSDYTFYSRYSQYIPEKKRRETWDESVERVFNMHRIKYKEFIDKNNELSDLINFAEKSQKQKIALGSQRLLQVGGPLTLKRNERNFNCSAIAIDRPKAFQDICWVLLAGCGSGFSVQRFDVERLPKVLSTKVRTRSYIVPDTCEGWSDAVGVLLSSYFEDGGFFKEYRDCDVKFDYSQIRSKGSLIAGQFKAPGPDPLKNGLNKIKGILDKVNSEGRQLKAIEAFDIVMHCADFVVSSGLRRSATIALFSKDDEEMCKAKTGSWFKDNPQRGRANISAVLVKDQITKGEFSKIFQNTREFGEPGFEFFDSELELTNPCLPKWAKVLTKQGIKELEDIKIGDEIWSKEGWTKVLNKWTTGIKKVFAYKTSRSVFYGTENHRLVSNGQKIEAKNCESFDCFLGGDLGPFDIAEYEGDSSLLKTTLNFPVVSSEFVSEEEVFDITVDNSTHTFWCNGVDTSNCSEIKWYVERSKDLSEPPVTTFCNLSEINGKYCSTEERFYEACRAAAIMGTLQAGYTDFPYLGKNTEEFVRKESLLGVSITGWMENPEILFNKEILKKGAQIVKDVNRQVAKAIDINPAARLCTAKPSGHTSCILSTSSGIHPHHAKRYIRRVQSNKQEFVAQVFEKSNPLATENSVWSSNNSDYVLSFLCEVPSGAIMKNQIGAIDLLEKVKIAQKYWVNEGINDELNIKKGLAHSVSNTITVKPEEWQDVEDYIFNNKKFFTGISLLASSGDLDYAQAPFSTVLTPKEMVHEYGDASVFASGLIVDALKAFSDNLWAACDCALGVGENLDLDLKEPEYPTTRNYKDLAKYFEAREKYELWFLKKDFIRRVKQFSDRYFDGDLKKTTYCLKHVSLWKRWCDLKREYVDIDWTAIKEEKAEYQNADEQAAASCHGGKCELF